MPKIKETKKGERTVISLKLEKGERVDMGEMGFIISKRFPNIAAMSMSGNKLVFEPRAYTSLSALCAQGMTADMLLRYIGKVVTVLRNITIAQLNPEALCLDARYIFADVYSGEVEIIYNPIKGAASLGGDVKAFVYNTVNSTRVTGGDFSKVSKVIVYLNDPAFNVGDLLAIIKEGLKSVPVSAPTVQPAAFWSCPNCGSAVQGNYCMKCGTPNPQRPSPFISKQ